MDIKIKYQDIIDRCEKLSAFEAEGKVDANGESRYLDIHINEVDKLLITDYIKQAQEIIEERIDRMLVEVNDYIDEITETTTAFPPSYVFYGIVKGTDGGVMGQYKENVEEQSTKPNGTLMYLDWLGKFAIVAEKANPTGSEKYDAYTHESAVGKNYIYEEGVVKGYYTFPADGFSYTWNSKGTAIEKYKGYIDVDVTTYNVVGLSWTLRDDTRWNGSKSFVKHVTEAIVAYTMAAWLRGRLDERVGFYENLYNNTLALAVKNIFTKQAPKK